MAKMKAAQVPKAGADFEIVEREIPTAGTGQVRIQVHACGVCHSDSFTKEGLYPGITYPRVPGHEVAGVIDEVGAGVTQWIEHTSDARKALCRGAAMLRNQCPNPSHWS